MLNYSNLAKAEWSALLSLRNRRDVVIKPVDHGGSVVWRTGLYKQEALRQLSDTDFYSQVDKDITPSNQTLVKEIVKSLMAVYLQLLIISNLPFTCHEIIHHENASRGLMKVAQWKRNDKQAGQRKSTITMSKMKEKGSFVPWGCRVHNEWMRRISLEL